jgi:hypothetical protein
MNWKAKVQDVYDSIEDLEGWDALYGVVARCGYESAEEMWEENALIGGSVNPSDFGRVKEKKSKKHKHE